MIYLIYRIPDCVAVMIMGGIGVYFSYGIEDFFNEPDIMAGMGILFGFLAIFLFICMSFGLVTYILQSIGLYKLTANRGMSNPGLAWIPFVGIFRAGAIADDIAALNGTKTYFRYFILGGQLFSWAFSGVSTGLAANALFSGLRHYRGGPMLGTAIINQSFGSIGSLVGIAGFVITIIALNKVYKCYTPASSTSWTVLSVIFPFMPSIFLFVIRNRAPVTDWYDSRQNYYPPAQPQNWQAPPPPNSGYQPPPYSQQHSGYYPPGTPSPPVYGRQPYQPPKAPNPPEPWEVADSRPEPPPAPPWNFNDNPPNGN